GGERRRACSPKESRRTDHLDQLEHRVLAEEAEQLVQGRDVDVVDDQQAAFGQVRVNEVVLELGKRVRMRSIEEGQLKAVPKLMPGQRDLRRPEDELCGAAVEKRGGDDRCVVRVELAADREDLVVEAELRKQQCALARPS